jgi:PhzF family phenazine biosynthesis protein
VLRPFPIDVQQWADLLGTTPDGIVDQPPAVKTQDGDVLVFVRDVKVLNALKPSMSALAEHSGRSGIRGICVATTSTLSPQINVQNRFFAPGVGVDEDPTTGSVYGPLGAHLLAQNLLPRHGDLAAITGVQATPTGRAGLVRGIVQQQGDNHFEVRIGAQSVTSMHGKVNLPGT